MTPEQLKTSILQHAMQGKLVEQRESEGTANDLFDDILKIAKKDKNVVPIQDDDIPFEIPSSWRWCRFGEITDCSMGKTPPRAEDVWWGDDIPWVSISDMTDYGHVIETKERVSQKALEEKFGAISKAGTLLMSFKLTVGRTSILDIDALHNEAIISIFPYVDKNEYFRDYLFYILPIVTQWGKSKNSIKGKTLNSKSIANLLIPLAPLEEMHRIVAKIEELLPYVDRYAEAYEKLEQFNAKFPEDMKKSILQYAIQGKLVEQRPEEGTAEELYQQIQNEKQKLIEEGKIKKEKPLAEITEDEIPFDIPDNWRWCYLGDVFSHTAGKALNSKNTSGAKYKYITTSNVYWDHFELDNLKEMYYTEEEVEKYSVQYGDLLVLEGGDVGRSAIWNLQESYCIQNHIHRLRPYTDVVVKYFYYAMMYFKLKGDIAGKGIGIKGLSAKALHCICIPLPPYEEQHRIVAKLEKLLPYCDKLFRTERE